MHLSTTPRRARRATLALAVSALAAGAVIAPGVATADPASRAVHPEKIWNNLTSDFWVKLNVRADNSAARLNADWAERGTQVAANLQAVADRSQAGAREILEDHGVDYTSYWISNAIFVRGGDRDLALELSALTEVESVFSGIRVEQDKPLPGVAEPKVGAVEWGIADINADDVWADYGVRGEGITVATIDTGVEYDHPALVNQYRGNLGGGEFDHNYNWFDVFGTSDHPEDLDIHGTHTMGTIVGDDGGGNQIGVAPGARWITSNAIGQGDFSLFLEAMEWMLEPRDLDGENPDASKRPNIISNSWGVAGVPTDPFGDDIQQAWIDSGIFGTWSNRNLGPSCGSTGSPGGRALSYSNGAYDINHVIADFSSRGPGQDGITKPNISGPGVNVRSSVPGGYDELSGTSMSTPHLAGTVALLWSAAPALIGDIAGTRELLDDTAVDVDATECGGTVDDNNVFGEGRLDALAAMDGAPIGDTGVVEGHVVDEETEEPIAGARVTFTGESVRETTTNEDGEFSITLVTGDYDVEATAFGYETGTDSVTVEDGETAHVHMMLTPAESYSLAGRVKRQSDQSRLEGAVIRIEGTPLETVSNENGRFRFPAVPVGKYRVTSEPTDKCLVTRTKRLDVDGDRDGKPGLDFLSDEIIRFKHGMNRDAFGYSCAVEPALYEEAETTVPLTGDEAVATVSLPFEFPYYGSAFNQVELSTNGHVRFVPFSEAVYINTPIPDPSVPNGVIAPMWDDLFPDASSSILTTSGDGYFLIEYRNVPFYDSVERVDFTITLFEEGQILFNYRNLDVESERELGSSATIGIENANGTIGIEYSRDSASLDEGSAIRFSPPPGMTATR